ncbi:TonB-dependent receptor plug domain-containing protein [Congregicoccus parvus]|uniref:TonB-dependent receptor plug domain-containing protein n=1 Tax=Congregicoccus parvus TaxID=3081749 RepID=UPI003FA55798
MNTNLSTKPRRALHFIAHASAMALLASAVSAQQTASPTGVDAGTLSRFDTNGNGVLDPSERAAMDAEMRRAASASAPAATQSEDDPIVLSPFEIVSEQTGYFQANAMSGTRLGSKIEDLAQSITVMTKEQMTDFAMLDVNDVFDYMAGTEGTGSYSEFVTDRTGAVVDNVSLNPNNANRVRGIGNANIAFNNIATTGRVPVDPLWMDSLELSRGPNANIFGLGNASGTVNQVPATANLSRDFARVEGRADSYGGWRASFDANRTLLDDKLALRASYAYQHTAFERKPSGQSERRTSVQLKARPLKNTTLAVSWYGYEAKTVRPNFTTPRDYYTNWFARGQPGWNPVTRLVTLANGDVYGNGNVLGSTTPYTSNPNFFTGGAESRSMFQIGAPGEAPYWSRTRYSGNPATPAGNNFATTDPYAASSVGIGLLTTGPSDTFTATQQPLYNSVARPIDDKSIYDWTKINLAANSKAWDDVDILLAQLDQVFINTPKQTLAAQVTVMREDAKRLENQPMGPASVNSNVGQLQVDVNTHYLDGTPNPYFGRPYLRSSEPFLRDRPWLWETARAQAVYRLDFSQDEGLSKWLGTQQILGYYEYKDQQNRIYTYRHTALGLDHGWQQKYNDLNAPLGNQSNANNDPRYLAANGALLVPGGFSRINEQYYVGSTRGGSIEYAPSYFPEGAVLPYVWGPSADSMFYDESPIGFTPSPDKGGGLTNVNTVVKTLGGVLQSTLFDGRLIGTFGLRQDQVSDRNAPFALLTPDLREYDFEASSRWNSGWRVAEGDTKSLSIVARPFRDLGFLKSESTGRSGLRRHLADAVRSLSFTYNKSDNFIAQGPAYDLFLNQLPNQTGTSTDIGVWVTLLEGKLSLRYVKFDTEQLNLRNGDISTMAQRILRYEGFVANDAWNLRKQVTAWVNGLGTGGTATNEQIAAAIQMPIEQYNGLVEIGANGTYAAVNDAQSKGHELEINYNPNRFWTVSASVTKTQAINTAAGAAVDEYIAARMPVWTTLEDPRYTATTATIDGVTTPLAPHSIPTGATGHLLWWHILGSQFNTGAVGAGYNNTNSAATNFAGNVNAPMAVFRALIGRPRPQVREYSVKFNTKYNLAGISENKILKNMTVGGSLRYSSKGSIGFYGLGYTDGMDLTLPANRILELDTNRPIYSPSETYIDLFVSYNTRLFDDKVRARFQLNAKNVGESGGRLQPTSAFFDGRTSTFRIIDPRQFIFSASFEF